MEKLVLNLSYSAVSNYILPIVTERYEEALRNARKAETKAEADYCLTQSHYYTEIVEACNWALYSQTKK